MGIRQALARAAALASKGDRASILRARNGIPAGVVYRSGAFWSHTELGHDFPVDIIVDAKEAAAAARKVKAESWNLKTVHDIPTELELVGGDSSASVQAVSIADSGDWFPHWAAEDAEWHTFSPEEWLTFLSVKTLASDDKIRLGHRCVRFCNWGIEAGDEAQYGRATTDAPFFQSQSVEASSLAKLAKTKTEAKVSFTRAFAFFWVEGERRAVRIADAWFPPVEKLLPTELVGLSSVSFEIKDLLAFMRSIKRKADRRVIHLAGGKDALHFWRPEMEEPLSLPTVAENASEPLEVTIDGNRLLETLRHWPSKNMTIGWIPAWGQKTFLRLKAPGLVQHLFPLMELKNGRN